jgi:hypothetical protein
MLFIAFTTWVHLFRSQLFKTFMKLPGRQVVPSINSLSSYSKGIYTLALPGIRAISETEGGENHVIQASRRQTFPQKTFPELPCIFRKLALSGCRDGKYDYGVLREKVL